MNLCWPGIQICVHFLGLEFTYEVCLTCGKGIHIYVCYSGLGFTRCWVCWLEAVSCLHLCCQDLTYVAVFGPGIHTLFAILARKSHGACLLLARISHMFPYLGMGFTYV